MVYGRRDRTAVPIRECDPPCLCAGDVVAFTFNLTYQVTDKDWHPQYQPLEVYVLKQSPYADLSEYELPRSDRDGPAAMDANVVEGCYDAMCSDVPVLIRGIRRVDGRR